MFLSSASSCVYFDTITACWRKQCACVHLCKSACVRARERVQEREKEKIVRERLQVRVTYLCSCWSKSWQRRARKESKKGERNYSSELKFSRCEKSEKRAQTTRLGCSWSRSHRFDSCHLNFYFAAYSKWKRNLVGQKVFQKFQSLHVWEQKCSRLIATCLTGSLGCFFGCEVMGSNPSTQTNDLLRGNFPV